MTVVFVAVLVILLLLLSSSSPICRVFLLIPDTNYVPREHNVAAILLLLFMVLISLLAVLNLLHFYISTFRSMCAVPNMAVFCSSLTLLLLLLLLTNQITPCNRALLEKLTGP